MEIERVVRAIGVFFTAFGFGAFLLGVVTLSLDWIQIGLLSMILGEVIDVPKR